MDVDIAQVQAAVQQLVMEHGEYAPLEWLLATNRLGYEDYRAWREGRLETPDAVLADAKCEIRAWLEGAQSWADAHGLAAQPAPSALCMRNRPIALGRRPPGYSNAGANSMWRCSVSPSRSTGFAATEAGPSRACARSCTATSRSSAAQTAGT